MRVTNQLIINTVLTNLDRGRERLRDLQTKAATGMQIQRPSDDPIGSMRVLKLNLLLRDQRQFSDNIENGSSWLTMTEKVLNEASTVIGEVKTTTVSGSNDSLGPSERRALAVQVDSMLEHLVALGNSRLEGKYIFAGTHTLTMPYLAENAVQDEGFTARVGEAVRLAHADLSTGTATVTTQDGATTFVEGVDYTLDYAQGTITALADGGMAESTAYVVDYETRTVSSVSLGVSSTAGNIDREIGEKTMMPVNISGEAVFDGTINAFEVLVRLKDGLLRNDGDGVRGVMDDLDAVLDQIISVSGAVGARMHRLQLSELRIQSEILHTQELLSTVQEIDLAETLTRLKAEELTYQTALSVGGRIVLPTLLDFIK
jgi:flagellar hook-associated protein 3 FlgL